MCATALLELLRAELTWTDCEDDRAANPHWFWLGLLRMTQAGVPARRIWFGESGTVPRVGSLRVASVHFRASRLALPSRASQPQPYEIRTLSSGP